MMGTTTNQDFCAEAASRETSDEIMQAIDALARHDYDEAVRIWEEPTEAELIAIWERVTGNGLRPSSDYFWGFGGSRWAADVAPSA